MKLAIMQPYIFPYLGYFQLINSVDTFVILDDVNYITRGWINRNKIMVNGAEKYITIPLEKQSQNKLICDHYFYWDNNWSNKILKTINHAYSKALFYNEIIPILNFLFTDKGHQSLVEFNFQCLKAISDRLEINANFEISSTYDPNPSLKGSERIINLCNKFDAKTYINAIGGKELYAHEDFYPINLRFIKRLDNENNLSIIDILMRNGFTKTKELIKQYELIE